MCVFNNKKKQIKIAFTFLVSALFFISLFFFNLSFNIGASPESEAICDLETCFSITECSECALIYELENISHEFEIEIIDEIDAAEPQTAQPLSEAREEILTLTADMPPYGAMLENYLVFPIDIRDSGNNQISNCNIVYLHEQYTITLYFAAKSSHPFEYNENGHLSYWLPEGIYIPQEVAKTENGTPQIHRIVNAGDGREIGSFTISNDNQSYGLIEVWFDNPTFLTDFPALSFFIRFDAEFTEIGEYNQIYFGNDGYSVVVTVPDMDVNIIKTAQAYNKNTKTISYTIELEALNGPVNGLTLTDLLKLDNIIFDTSIDDAKFITNFNAQINGSGAPLRYALSYDPKIGILNIDFPDYPEGFSLEKKGDRLIITYDMALDSLIGESDSYDHTIENTFTAAFQDKTKSDSTKTPVYANTNLVLTKESGGYNAEDKTISYNITLEAAEGTIRNILLTELLKWDGNVFTDLDAIKDFETRLHDGFLHENLILNALLAYEGDILSISFIDSDRNPVSLTLTEGQTLTISYKLDLTDLINDRENYDHTITNAFTADYEGNSKTEITSTQISHLSYLDIQKTGGSFNNETNKIPYTITFEAKNGSVSGIRLKDLFVCQSQFMSVHGMNASSISDFKAIRINKSSPSVPEDITDTLILTYQFHELIVDFPAEFILAEGDTIIITYIIDVSYLVDKFKNNSFNYHFIVYNTATVEYDEDKNASSIGYSNAQNIFLTKYGESSPDKTSITWNARVGDGVIKLNGKKITDKLGPNLIFNTDSVINAQLRGQDDSLIKEEAVSFVIVDGVAVSFEYTVPEGFGDVYYVYFNSCKTTITVPITESEIVFTNTISIPLDGSNPSYTAEVTIQPPPPGYPPGLDDTELRKFGKPIADEHGKLLYIEWSVDLFIPYELAKQLSETHSAIWLDDVLTINAIPGSPREVENIPLDVRVTMWKDSESKDSATVFTDHILIHSKTPGFIESWSTRNAWALFFDSQQRDDVINIVNDRKKYSKPFFEEDMWINIVYHTSADAKLVNGISDAPINDMKTIGDVFAFFSANNELFNFNVNNLVRLVAFDNKGNQTPEAIRKTAEAQVNWPIKKHGTVQPDGAVLFIIELNPDWKLGYAGGVISDTFNDIMMVKEGSLGVVITSGGYDYDFKFTGIMPVKDNQNGTRTLTIDFSQPGWEGVSGYTQSGCRFQIYYELTIRDSLELNYEVLLLNTASIQLDGNWYMAGYELIYGGEKGKGIEKDMVPRGSIAEITVEINKESRQLGAGAGTLIHVADTMSSYLAYIPSSIEVAKYTDGQWVPIPYNHEDPNPEWYFIPQSAQEIRFYLPDATRLKITYNARINGDVGQVMELWNEIWLAGQYFDKAGEAYRVQSVGAGAQTSWMPVMLIKKDAETESLLPGAKYALYANFNNELIDKIPLPSDTGIEKTMIIGGYEYHFLEYKESTVRGAEFKSPWLVPQWPNPADNIGKMYALVELEAPQGYVLPQFPGNIHLFSFNELSEEAIVNAGRPVEVTGTGLLTVSNNPWKFRMPETGGSGTIPYVAGGLLIMALGGWLYMLKKNN